MRIDRHASYWYREDSWTEKDSLLTESLVARFEAGRPFEADVSRLLAAPAEPTGSRIAHVLLELANVSDPGESEIWVGSDWLRSVGGRRHTRDTRSPDLIVTSRADRNKVHLILELKGNAAINCCYCPEHSEELGYANQIICQLSNCWTDANMSDLPRILVGPDRNKTHPNGIIGNKGIRESWAADGYGAAYLKQQEALNEWRFAGLRELADKLDSLPDEPAAAAVREGYTLWINRIGC